jgi:hypothetical protein
MTTSIEVPLAPSGGLKVLETVDAGSEPWGLHANGRYNNFIVWIGGAETEHNILLKEDGTWEMTTAISV